MFQHIQTSDGKIYPMSASAGAPKWQSPDPAAPREVAPSFRGSPVATLTVPLFRRVLDLTNILYLTVLPRTYPRTDQWFGWRQVVEHLPQGSASVPVTTIYRSHFRPPANHPELKITPFGTWSTSELTMVANGNSTTVTSRLYDLNTPAGILLSIRTFTPYMTAVDHTTDIFLPTLNSTNFSNGNWTYSAETLVDNVPANDVNATVYVRELRLSPIQAVPDPFIPGAGRTQTLTTNISIDPEEPASLSSGALNYTYVATVKNAANTTIKEWRQAVSATVRSPLTFTWDGLDVGVPASAGTFALTLNASDEKTSANANLNLTLVGSPSPSPSPSPSVSPSPSPSPSVSPGPSPSPRSSPSPSIKITKVNIDPTELDPSTGNVSVLEAQITAIGVDPPNIQVTSWIQDSTGTNIRTLPPQVGNHPFFIWDGTDDNGDVAALADYIWVVNAVAADNHAIQDQVQGNISLLPPLPKIERIEIIRGGIPLADYDSKLLSMVYFDASQNVTNPIAFGLLPAPVSARDNASVQGRVGVSDVIRFKINVKLQQEHLEERKYHLAGKAYVNDSAVGTFSDFNVTFQPRQTIVENQDVFLVGLTSVQKVTTVKFFGSVIGCGYF